MIKCPKFQFENPEDSQFCLECGVKIELKCPNCSRVLPIGAKFCNGCGQRAERTKPPGQYHALLEAFFQL